MQHLFLKTDKDDIVNNRWCQQDIQRLTSVCEVVQVSISAVCLSSAVSTVVRMHDCTCCGWWPLVSRINVMLLLYAMTGDSAQCVYATLYDQSLSLVYCNQRDLTTT